MNEPGSGEKYKNKDENKKTKFIFNFNYFLSIGSYPLLTGNNDRSYEKAATKSSSYVEMHPIMVWLTGRSPEVGSMIGLRDIREDSLAPA